MRDHSFLVGKDFNVDAITRMFKEIQEPRKKVTICACKSDPVLVELHYLGLIGVDRTQLFFGDETHFSNENGINKFEYSVKGLPAIVRDVFVRKYRGSIVAVMGVGGVIAHAMREGSINGDQFKHFILVCVVGGLKEGDRLILDDASIRKNEILSTMLQLLGITLGCYLHAHLHVIQMN